eukprot:gene33344-41144_t
MDYYMPVMSGPEAVHLIRQQGYKGVILAVTGVSTDSEFTSLLGKGVDRILVKPFNLDEFKRTLREMKRKQNNLHSDDGVTIHDRNPDRHTRRRTGSMNLNSRRMV